MLVGFVAFLILGHNLELAALALLVRLLNGILEQDPSRVFRSRMRNEAKDVRSPPPTRPSPSGRSALRPLDKRRGSSHRSHRRKCPAGPLDDAVELHARSASRATPSAEAALRSCAGLGTLLSQRHHVPSEPTRRGNRRR